MAIKLGTLQIIGKISPCSEGVFVQSQVIGAKVTLTATRANALPRVVGFSDATWPVDTITLFANAALEPGVDSISAQQSKAGYLDSDYSDVAPVLPLPTAQDLSIGAFSKPLYACARCVRLVGLFPYAKVEIVGSTERLGEGIVGADGVADIPLQRRELRTADAPLRAYLTGCNGAKSKDPIIVEIILGLPVPLPAPSANLPASCSAVVDCNSLTPGGRVLISRGTQVWAACAPAPSMSIRIPPLAPPVAGDNTLQVQQVFVDCGAKTDAVAVSIRDHIDAPKFVPSSAVCVGAPSVLLSGLEEGADVEFTLPNGQQWLVGAKATALPLPVPSLTAGVLRVRQNLCHADNSWSPYAQIAVGDTMPSAPTLLYPPDGAVNVDLRGPAQWLPGPATACNTTNDFWLQVATARDFQPLSLKVNRQHINGNGWTFYKPGDLPAHQTLYWRVGAQQGTNVVWSPVWKFTTTVEQADTTSPPPQPAGLPGTYQFVEDCCPNYRRVVWATGASQADAQQKVEKQSPNCRITPYDGVSVIDPCSLP